MPMKACPVVPGLAAPREARDRADPEAGVLGTEVHVRLHTLEREVGVGTTCSSHRPPDRAEDAA
jgi:hypothetical protein